MRQVRSKSEAKALKDFGKRLKELREEVGISQEKLALKVNIHRNYIGNIERGVQNPSLILLLKIFKGLGLSLGDFVKDLEKELTEIVTK